MKTLHKLSITAMFLFMSGCAHYGGYYSDYAGGSAYGVHVDGYVPYNPYTIYYQRRHWNDHDRYEKHWKRGRYRDDYSHKRKHFGYGREFRRWSDKRRYRGRDYGHFPRSENRWRKHRQDWGGNRSGYFFRRDR